MPTIAAIARREASARLHESHRLNVGPGQPEYAYTPSTGAIGVRFQDPTEPEWSARQVFRVFNIYYPMYGRSEQVRDWVSVGMAIPKVRRPA